MRTVKLPPEIQQRLVTALISSSGIEFDSAEVNRWSFPTLHKYFDELHLDKTYYGQYFIVPCDGMDDGLYAELKPCNLPLLTFCKRVGQQHTYLLPTLALLDSKSYRDLRALAEQDMAYSKKRAKMVWYGGLSGPLPLRQNDRCRFVSGASVILDRIGLANDIKFTHLFDRASLYRPEFGRYEPGSVSPKQQLGERFLVALDGNSYPSNLHWILAVNSLVFRNQSPWRCILDDFFFAGHDYVYFASDLSDFETQVRFALDNETEMSQIVTNSTMKMRALTRELIDDHVRAALRQIQYGRHR